MTSALTADDIARVLAKAAPADPIAAWEATAVPYPVLTPSTESLDRVVGVTADGRRVHVFAKTIRSMRHWPLIGMLPEAQREAAIARFPWRVEAEVYASPLVRDLPDGLRAPRIYAIDDLGDDRIRLWMEDVPDTGAVWDAGRYSSAARRLGRLAGRTLRDGLPSGAPDLFAGLRMLWAMRIATTLIPALRDAATWRHPLMAAVARSDPALRDDLLALADVAPSILDRLDALPRGLAHGDACPQNLLPDPLRGDGLVAIDWGFTSLAPLGSDLVQLLAGRVEGGEVGPEALPAIDEIVFPAYLDGLREERVDPDPADVRLGFLGGMLVGKTFSALPLERLGGPADADATVSFLRRSQYARYLLDLRPALGSLA